MKKAINKSHDYSYLHFPLMCTNVRPKLKVGQILAYFSYLSIVFVGLPTINLAFHIASFLPFTLPPFTPPSLIDSDAGRDWGQEEKGTTEDEMAGWHH